MNYRNMAIRFADALWTYGGICPECGNNKPDHMTGCKEVYEKLDNPRKAGEIFKEAFESNSK